MTIKINDNKKNLNISNDFTKKLLEHFSEYFIKVIKNLDPKILIIFLFHLLQVRIILLKKSTML